MIYASNKHQQRQKFTRRLNPPREEPGFITWRQQEQQQIKTANTKSRTLLCLFSHRQNTQNKLPLLIHPIPSNTPPSLSSLSQIASRLVASSLPFCPLNLASYSFGPGSVPFHPPQISPSPSKPRSHKRQNTQAPNKHHYKRRLNNTKDMTSFLEKTE